MERPDYAQEFARYLSREKHLALMIRDRVELWGATKVALRHRASGEWGSYTWAEFGEQMDLAAKALLEWGVKPGEMVAIFSGNRAEWSIVDLAILSIRAVSVPIYATDTAKEVEYIVDDAQTSVIFVGNQDQYDRTKTVAASSKHLKKIVVFDSRVTVEPSADTLSFGSFLELGRKVDRQADLSERLAAADCEDLATLIYTSGTTGEPKGVMLTHKAFLAMLFGTGYHQPVDETDASLAFLPLSHVFERAWTYLVLSRGAENHYCHDPKALMAFLREVRPTYMTSVPRVWEKVHAAVMDGRTNVSSPRRMLFDWAIDVGHRVGLARGSGGGLSPLLALQYWLADRLVLRKIRDLFGGRAKVINVGGAAFSAQIAEFFFSTGVLLLQGYGLTECFVISVASPKANRFGMCGRVVPLVEVRISEEGEIQARGPNTMKGYYKKPELTQAAFTPDGWIRTGDVGAIDESGFLTITDRIKELIKTSGGKYVAPQHLEMLLKEDLYIEQAVVVGDRRNYVSALVVPSFMNLEQHARQRGIAYSSREELIARPEIVELYRGKIEHQTRDVGQVQKIKRFTLLPHEFTQEAGEITPTQKIRRKIVSEKYGDLIEAMYRD